MSEAGEGRPQQPVRILLGRVGSSYPPLALLARLPFAMMVVGVLTLVVTARGSVQLGGVNSAMAGLGVACVGPALAAAADRYGQRPVLLLCEAINSVLLGAFTWVAFSPLPDWISGPVAGKETIVYGEIDLDRVAEEQMEFDASGHYNRPDVFQLTVDMREKAPAKWLRDSPQNGVTNSPAASTEESRRNPRS